MPRSASFACEIVPAIHHLERPLTTPTYYYQGKRIVFVTNSASLSRKEVLAKLTSMGIKAFPDEIYTSAFAAAAFLQQKKGFSSGKKKVYCIGEKGIMDELNELKITALGGPDDDDKKLRILDDGDPVMDVDPAVAAVVVGADRGINYYKIQYGLTCLLENKGCEFIATNTDARGNFSVDQEWAGAGASVGALIGASELEPIVLGKPSPFLLDAICNKYGVPRNKCAIIGDRLDTDILWGAKHGCKTILVLTGITSLSFLHDSSNKIQPTCYIESIADLLAVKDKVSYSTCNIQ